MSSKKRKPNKGGGYNRYSPRHDNQNKYHGANPNRDSNRVYYNCDICGSSVPGVNNMPPLCPRCMIPMQNSGRHNPNTRKSANPVKRQFDYASRFFYPTDGHPQYVGLPIDHPEPEDEDAVAAYQARKAERRTHRRGGQDQNRRSSQDQNRRSSQDQHRRSSQDQNRRPSQDHRRNVQDSNRQSGQDPNRKSNPPRNRRPNSPGTQSDHSGRSRFSPTQTPQDSAQENQEISNQNQPESVVSEQIPSAEISKNPSQNPRIKTAPSRTQGDRPEQSRPKRFVKRSDSKPRETLEKTGNRPSPKSAVPDASEKNGKQVVPEAKPPAEKARRRRPVKRPSLTIETTSEKAPEPKPKTPRKPAKAIFREEDYAGTALTDEETPSSILHSTLKKSTVDLAKSAVSTELESEKEKKPKVVRRRKTKDETIPELPLASENGSTPASEASQS